MSALSSRELDAKVAEVVELYRQLVNASNNMGYYEAMLRTGQPNAKERFVKAVQAYSDIETKLDEAGFPYDPPMPLTSKENAALRAVEGEG